MKVYSYTYARLNFAHFATWPPLHLICPGKGDNLCIGGDVGPINDGLGAMGLQLIDFY